MSRNSLVKVNFFLASGEGLYHFNLQRTSFEGPKRQCFRDPKIGRSSSGRKKKKKKLPDEVRPDEVHPGSGKNGWGEGPGYIVKWTSGVRPRRGRTPPRIEK